MKLEHLQYLVTTADTGSISKASDKLFVNQQYLSKIVQGLENDLSCTIFERTNRGVKLTHEGELVYDAARMILDTMEDLQKQLKKEDEVSGSLKIVAVNSFRNSTMYRVVELFSEQYPLVRLGVTELPLSQVIDQIKNDSEVIGYIAYDETGYLSLRPNLEKWKRDFIPFSEKRLGILVSSNSSYSNLSEISVKTIDDLDFVSLDIGGEGNFDKYFQEHENKKYAFSSIDAVREFVKNGKAMALATEKSEGYFESSGLAFIPFAEGMRIRTGLVVPQECHCKKLAQLFIDRCLDVLDEGDH